MERKCFSGPLWKQFDQGAVGDQMLNAECQDLRDARAGNAGSNHGIDIRQRQTAGCFDGHDFLPAMEFPLEGFSRWGSMY